MMFTVSRKIANILNAIRKSHHSIETLSKYHISLSEYKCNFKFP